MSRRIFASSILIFILLLLVFGAFATLPGVSDLSNKIGYALSNSESDSVLVKDLYPDEWDKVCFFQPDASFLNQEIQRDFGANAITKFGYYKIWPFFSCCVFWFCLGWAVKVWLRHLYMRLVLAAMWDRFSNSWRQDATPTNGRLGTVHLFFVQ